MEIKRTFSDEHRNNLSLALKGKTRSLEFCEKMRIANIGKKHSLETKHKMSLAHKGRFLGEKNPMFGKKFSEEHKAKLRLAWKTRTMFFKNGGKHNLTKGGITIDGRGYIKVFMPNHPYAHSSGYIMQHRVIMEKHIGRYLTKEEVVHHKDENKQNNDLSNLELLKNRKEHMKIHQPNLPLSNPSKTPYLLTIKKELISDYTDKGYSIRKISANRNLSTTIISRFLKQNGLNIIKKPTRKDKEWRKIK